MTEAVCDSIFLPVLRYENSSITQVVSQPTVKIFQHHSIKITIDFQSQSNCTVIQMTDHREKARIAAIVSRRRAQLSRLERLITEVRKQLEADEQKLERVPRDT